MEQIELVLRRAVKNINPLMDVKKHRDYGEKRSAGFQISCLRYQENIFIGVPKICWIFM